MSDFECSTAEAASLYANDYYQKRLPLSRKAQPRQRIQANTDERIFEGLVILMKYAVTG